MDFTFFYTQNQLDGFLNSRFSSTVLCPEADRQTSTMIEDHQSEIGVLSPQLEKILEEIATTKMLIDPVIEQYIESIEDESILELLKYNNRTWSWREKSFLMRVCTLSLGAEFTVPLLKAASAIELLGMSFCLIDDIIDESSFYDLKQTAWAKYGYKETICASEILTSLAHNALIDACCEAKISGDDFKTVMQIFQTIQYDAYASQFMDIESEHTPNFSEDRYFEMTSKFPGTFYEGAIRIACLLSSINDNRVTKLQEYGRLLAMANQIRDDLVEIIGDEDVIGKQIGSDILLNKKRLPLILFIDRYEEYQSILLERSLNDESLIEILNSMRNNGVVDECVGHIKRFISKALIEIHSLKKNNWTILLANLSLVIQTFEDS